MPHPPRGYCIYCCSHTNHPAPGNGLTLLVSNASSCLQVLLTTPLQAQVFVIGLRKSFTICNIYISPNEDVSYNDIKSLINQLPTPFILTGDVNAKHPMWGSDTTDPHGRVFSQALVNLDISLLNNGAKTHYHVQTNTLSVIDVTICSSDLQAELVWDVDGDPRGSDHYSIIVGISPNRQ